MPPAFHRLRRSCLRLSYLIQGSLAWSVASCHAEPTLFVLHPGPGQDATAVLQAALDGPAAEIVLEAHAGEWLTGPLRVRRDDVRLTLQPGTVLRGLSGAFPGKEDALLTVEKRRGFTLIAHGAELVMPGADFTEGEHRHCLNLRSVERVRIHGGTYAHSGGDGIYLGTRDGRRSNHDIVITDVVCRANRRQGMSVTCASQLVLRDCLFLDTRGTAPEAGLDFEPNHEADFFTACVVSHCLAINNAAQGFENHFNRLRPGSRPIELTFDHCYAEGGSKYGFTVLASDPRAGSPLGLLRLERCVARRNGTAGIRTRNGSSGALRAVVKDSFILHPGSTDQRAPLWLLAQEGTPAPHGDLEVQDLWIASTEPRPPIRVTLQGSASQHGLGRITGALVVFHPAEVSLDPTSQRLLPDLPIRHELAEVATLTLHQPQPGSTFRRGTPVPLDATAHLPASEPPWQIRLAVRHDAKVVFEQTLSDTADLAHWTPAAHLRIGLYSIWITLLDQRGRVHDMAASAVLLVP